jgi:LysM repeat protein
MNKRTSVFARILAALALVAAVVAVVVAVSNGIGGNSSSGSHHGGQTAKQEPVHHRTKAKTYTVKTGDTLIAISHHTGVPIFEIKALNPEVDPQILIAGETLKLR